VHSKVPTEGQFSQKLTLVITISHPRSRIALSHPWTRVRSSQPWERVSPSRP